jgi:hypothetical protein
MVSLPPFRHGVAGVHREVENGSFGLGGVGFNRPDAAAANLERDVLAKCAPEKIRQSVEHAVDVADAACIRPTATIEDLRNLLIFATA